MRWPDRACGPVTGRFVQFDPFHCQVSPSKRVELSRPPKRRTTFLLVAPWNAIPGELRALGEGVGNFCVQSVPSHVQVSPSGTIVRGTAFTPSSEPPAA